MLVEPNCPACGTGYIRPVVHRWWHGLSFWGAVVALGGLLALASLPAYTALPLWQGLVLTGLGLGFVTVVSWHQWNKVRAAWMCGNCVMTWEAA